MGTPVPSQCRALLLTGRPGVGKTTLVMDAVRHLSGAAEGFYTQEVRHGPQRIGFDLVTLQGERVALARQGSGGPHRVGRYQVDVSALDRVGVAALRRALATGDLAVVDEIGKMELLSAAFRDAIWRLLEAARPLLGTIMLAPHPEADRIKAHPSVRVLTVTPESRGAVAAQVAHWLASLGQPGGGQG